MKYIIVTGGVLSGLGKGITSSSIGVLLQRSGYRVTAVKIDPYLNCDAGTMNPYEHGEVFVMTDGSEVDLDLGNYERFLNCNLTAAHNITTGKVFRAVIEKERRGDYLGQTVQIIPHVVREIVDSMRGAAESASADICLVELGGTVGDIEGLPFLEAIRQMRNDVGRDNVFYIHLTLLPYIAAAQELKTKPTQHSVKELRSIGIQPDAILCRSDHPVSESICEKISAFCDVPVNAVIPVVTVANVYEVPLILEEAGLGDIVVNALGLTGQPGDLTEWSAMVDRMNDPKESVSIALVGKYVEYPDSYISVREALRHAGLDHYRDIDLQWVHSEDIERDGPDAHLSDVCGIVVPGGFGPRGVEGMIETVRYAREHKVPYLGLCLGLQVMVIEWARNVLGIQDANSEELVPDTGNPVVHIMPDQEGVSSKGGTMRLGDYPCHPQSKTLTKAAYGDGTVMERHRHRFELNNWYRESLENSGLIVGGLSPDGNLVETGEVADHPFMVGTQYHPEFKSRPNRPHPLFSQFIGAAKKTIREGVQRPLPLDINSD